MGLRDIRKPSEEKHKIGTLHESKGVEGEGHQVPQMCLIISDLEFDLEKLRSTVNIG